MSPTRHASSKHHHGLTGTGSHHHKVEGDEEPMESDADEENLDTELTEDVDAVAAKTKSIYHRVPKKVMKTHSPARHIDKEAASQKMVAHEAFKRKQAANSKFNTKKLNEGNAKTASYLNKMKAMEEKWNSKKSQTIAVTKQMAAGSYVKPVQEKPVHEKKNPAKSGLGDFFANLGLSMK